MPELAQSMRAVIASTHADGGLTLPEGVQDFIEKITFASAEEILSSLRKVLAEDWLAMPVWARNLSYRLACLQRPNDPDLLREAAADLLSFGPDWDHIAEDLKSRARQLESE